MKKKIPNLNKEEPLSVTININNINLIVFSRYLVKFRNTVYIIEGNNDHDIDNGGKMGKQLFFYWVTLRMKDIDKKWLIPMNESVNVFKGLTLFWKLVILLKND